MTREASKGMNQTLPTETLVAIKAPGGMKE